MGPRSCSRARGRRRHERRVADITSDPLAEAQRVSRIRVVLDVDEVITLLTTVGGASAFGPDAGEHRHLQGAVAFILDAISVKQDTRAYLWAGVINCQKDS
ncbi:hypothetical protein DEI98_04220 [Curtobacterium sp. MCLR17_034]|nr:hypothetical protein DEI98_04220 [Curtobacterium sp. MCLR17_034]